MDDPVILYECKVDRKKEQPTGLLTPCGKPIVRLPNPVGFTAKQEKVYAVKI